MATASRLTSTGNLLVNGQLDEFSGIPIVDSSLQLWLDAGNYNSYNGTGTTWYDLSGNNNNGTLGRAPSWLVSVGGNFLFNGTLLAQYVSTPYVQPAYTTSSSFTWNVWALALPAGATRSEVMVGNRIQGNGSTSFDFTKFDNNFQFEYARFGAISVLTPTIYQTPNTWYNICIVKNQANFSYYVNGVLNVTMTVSNSAQNPQPFYIGGDAAYGEYSASNIASVMVYNRALTAAEVATNFNNTCARFKYLPVASATVATPADRIGYSFNSNNAVYQTQGVIDEVTGIPIVDTSLQLWLDAAQPASTTILGGNYPTAYNQSDWLNLINNGVNAYWNAAYDQSTFDPVANAFNFNPLLINPYNVPQGSLGPSNDGFVLRDKNQGTSYPWSNVGAFTIELWVKHTAVSTDGSPYNNIYSIYEYYQQTGYRFGANFNGTGTTATAAINFWTNQCGGNFAVTTSGYPVAQNQWCHIVVTYSNTSAPGYGGTIQIYVNGVQQTLSFSLGVQGKLTYFPGGANGGAFFIGTDSEGCQSFTGQMSVFKWYTRPLTAAEVATNYNAVAPRYSLPRTASAAATVKRVSQSGNVLVGGNFDEVTGAPVVDPGLVFWVDAAQPASYAGGAMTGSATWNSLVNYPTYSLTNTVVSNPNTGYIANQPVFNPANGGYFDFTAGNVQLAPYTAGTFGFQVYPAPEPVPLLGSFTLQAWVNRNSAFVPSGDRETIFSNATGASGFRFGIGNAANNNAIYYLLGTIRPTYYQEGYLGTTPVTDGKWHLLTVVFDRSAQLGSYTIYGYLDATMTGSVTIANGAAASALSLPTRADGAVTGVGNVGCCRQFGGKLSLIMVYNRALTAVDVNNNYLATRNRYL